MTPCMGGWCIRRESCQNYHARGGQPAERLCPKGRDMPDATARQARHDAQPMTLQQLIEEATA